MQVRDLQQQRAPAQVPVPVLAPAQDRKPPPEKIHSSIGRMPPCLQPPRRWHPDCRNHRKRPEDPPTRPGRAPGRPSRLGGGTKTQEVNARWASLSAGVDAGPLMESVRTTGASRRCAPLARTEGYLGASDDLVNRCKRTQPEALLSKRPPGSRGAPQKPKAVPNQSLAGKPLPDVKALPSFRPFVSQFTRLQIAASTTDSHG